MHLSNWLADCLDVDADKIKTNLVNHAHIKLQNVCILPWAILGNGAFSLDHPEDHRNNEDSSASLLACKEMAKSIDLSWKFGSGFG